MPQDPIDPVALIPQSTPHSAPRAPVSVIIPAYNSASILPDAVNSVLAQTLPPREIIIVDDGSADQTRSVASAFHDPVRCIHQHNAGASAARNTGARAATSEFLAFLDADDTWEPDKLELQLAAIGQNPQADFALSSALVWSPHARSQHEMRCTGSLDPRALRAELLVKNIFTGLCSSLLIRRAAFDAVRGFPHGKGSEDRRIAIDLLECHRAVIIDLPLIRQRPGPAHWTDPERQRAAMLDLIADYLPLYKSLDPSGRLLRRARARVHERSGMHYLENGDPRRAARDLVRAARLNPLLPNPWRVLINACLGRLKSPAAISR